jgi:hypothetical protein
MEVLRWWLVSRSLKNIKHQQPGTYNNPKPYPKPYPTPTTNPNTKANCIQI